MIRWLDTFKIECGYLELQNPPVSYLSLGTYLGSCGLLSINYSMSFYLALLFSKSEEYCMFRQILFPQQSVRKISRAYLE